MPEARKTASLSSETSFCGRLQFGRGSLAPVRPSACRQKASATLIQIAHLAADLPLEDQSAFPVRSRATAR
eukprot:2071259-Pyramimonas_sp.AAC.1